MKKKVTAILAGCLYAIVLGSLTLNANQVTEMEIDVALRTDGSAYITQTWNAETDEGTEFYLACHDNDYLTITDFSVSDEKGEYTFVEDWDIEASFEQKAGECGILETEDGVELCWGISEYGQHQYILEYVLHDLVGSYSDADGFNFRFVDEMNFFPTDVVLTIYNQDGTPLTDDVCDIWGFGFQGEIFFENGAIYAYSEKPLEKGQHVTVMASWEKGILLPQRMVEGSFEDVKELAFEGSDYEYQEDLSAEDFLWLLGLLAFLGGFVALIIAICVKIKKVWTNRRMQMVDYFRDAPNNGDLNVTHRLGLYCKLCKDDSLLGAYLLKLISQGCLEPESVDKDAKHVRLRLMHPPRSENKYEDILYTILEAAAGRGGILHARELEDYCWRNSKPITIFMKACEDDAEWTLVQSGCFKGVNRNGVKSLTEKGKQKLNEILGLKRFLLDFSLIHERGVKETILWQDYMVYALLLGIADKVAPQIRKLYPEMLPEVARFERCMGYAGYYNKVMYSAYARERQHQAARTYGSGGRVSVGGGSGYYGGGGGGTR